MVPHKREEDSDTKSLASCGGGIVVGRNTISLSVLVNKETRLTIEVATQVTHRFVFLRGE